MSETQVAADLVVNDLTAATFARIKKGFGSIEHSVNHVTSGMMGFVKSTASTALGFQLAGLPHMLHAIADNAIEAAMAAGKEEKSIAAALMMTDRKDRGYAELRGEATGLRKELREMGMEAGISGDSVVDSFNDIAARTNKGTAEVKEMMKQMVQAGRIAPGGLASITSGFEMLEMGVARARNPIVQMISSTGLLKGNARQVAKEMQKMAPDKMMELAETAIAKMAKKMEKVPLSFGEAVTSLKDMREQIFDAVGMPMFKGFAPIMRTVRDAFREHRAEIEEWGESVGRQAGEAIKIAGGYVKDAFGMIRENWDSIAHSIHASADALMGAGKFLVEHKDVLGRLAQFGTGGFTGAFSSTPGHTSAAGIGGDVAGGALAGGKLGGPAGAAIGAALGALGAMSEEASALGIALMRTNPRMGQWLTYTTATTNAILRENAARESQLDIMRKHVMANDKYISSAEGLLRSLNRPAMAEGSIGPTLDLPSEGFAEMAKGIATQADESTKMLADSTARNFMAMYQAAVDSNDAGQMNSVAAILESSKSLQYALVMSGKDVTAGFDDLIDAMVQGGRMTAEAGKQAKSLVGGKGKGLAAMGGVHVGGGNTVNMKMEFKEGDPDRIMTTFKAAFTKAAASRVQARVSGPFGGF